MITRIEAHRYRCLKSVSQPLGPFQVLVGPNGSGKSAFLDVLAFLGTAVSERLEAAVKERTRSFNDLVWGREETQFELAIEATIPEQRRVPTEVESYPTIRYDVAVGLASARDSVVFLKESVVVDGITVLERDANHWRLSGRAGDIGLAFGVPQSVSALSFLPSDDPTFSETAWLKDLLSNAVQYVRLDVSDLRNPSPPQAGSARRFTGSNLARLVAQLEEEHQENFQAWIAHVRTSLPDVVNIRTFLREEDRHRYLIVRYRNGVEVPSWTVSEGTLRLLALTLLAYLPDSRRIYLIEEPENGVHPTAIETIYQSLSSIYEGQVVMASHSPIVLGLAEPEQLLCFSMTSEGTRIVRGSEHPALRDWKGEVSLSDLFAAGVLG